MTRLQAIRSIRRGERLVRIFVPDMDLVSGELEVWVMYEELCDFSRHKRLQHQTIGPLHLRFWSGSDPHWIHISPKQLLRFIKRNYRPHANQ